MPQTLRHQPLRKPNSSAKGEHIFAAEWESTAGQSLRDGLLPGETTFESLLRHYAGPKNQRTATVVASVIAWLGTTEGQDFLARVRRLAKVADAIGLANPYLAVWGEENARHHTVNGGRRVLENLLSEASWACGALSGEDLEAADCVMMWLPTEGGREFLEKCSTLLSAAHLEERLDELARLGYASSDLYQSLRRQLSRIWKPSLSIA